jgi:hypothetical protein
MSKKLSIIVAALAVAMSATTSLQAMSLDEAREQAREQCRHMGAGGYAKAKRSPDAMHFCVHEHVQQLLGRQGGTAPGGYGSQYYGPQGYPY